MYPKVVVDLQKIVTNTRIVADICKEKSVDIMGVTKVFCGDPKVAEAEMKGGIKYFADSRLENLMKLKELDLPKILLRLPMISQVDDVVHYADISLNSEIKTIEALNIAAMAKKKVHKIILMIDLGDLREGILPAQFDETVEAIMKMDNIMLHGIGVNLTCYGGVIPSEKNLGQLVDFAKIVKEKYNHHLEIVSGGNSSSFYLVPQNRLPEGINNLRMGEILVLGRETAYGELVEGMYDDAFILEAEIVELKEKDSIPTGEIGMDAFGNKPTFVDKGRRMRAILAVGVQDVKADQLIPLDDRIDYLGSSSDHMMWDVTDADYKVGDIVSFKLEYGALLSLFTSEYVDKEYK
ncbi:MAG: alanine/ornithine racemase family PLP-dependent enzyme [Clostridiales bacterium]|nr:alanine/ornithine racemase family PLP-dependent enzyme [Clostridiales bacterium]